MDKFYDWLLIIGVAALLLGVLYFSWFLPTTGGEAASITTNVVSPSQGR